MHPKTRARHAALQSLIELETKDMLLPQVLAARLPVCPPETRPLARELVSGVLRHRALLDWTLAPLLKKPLHKLDAPVRAALRLAAYERTHLKTFPAVVGNEYASLMKTMRLASATGFVNAIARRLPEEPRLVPEDKPAWHLATLYSHPEWLVARWLERLGREECEKLLQFNNGVAPLCLRINSLRTSRETVLASLVERGLQAREGLLSADAIIVENAGDPTAWPEWEAGEIIAQDEAAQLVAPFGAPVAGQTVIDAAAAPGGKTTHLAQFMNNQGKIIACDVSEGRLKLVCDNAKRLGISVIETRAGDFREQAGRLPPVDMVLLDAPCLGTGTLRRRPDAKWSKTPAQLEELVALQRELLECATALVKPGGVLVYSTCSLEAEENEAQVAWWLEQDSKRQATMKNTLPHRDSCDGMFAARLVVN